VITVLPFQVLFHYCCIVGVSSENNQSDYKYVLNQPIADRFPKRTRTRTRTRTRRTRKMLKTISLSLKSAKDNKCIRSRQPSQRSKRKIGNMKQAWKCKSMKDREITETKKHRKKTPEKTFGKSSGKLKNIFVPPRRFNIRRRNI